MSPRRRLLVAEDDDADFFLLREILEELLPPTAVLCRARDGKELLDLVNRRDEGVVGLVLLDWRMPGMDGAEALARLKADAATRLIPVVVLSNAALPQEVRHAYELGAAAYVQKPSDTQALAGFSAAVCDLWIRWAVLPDR
jgi:CheY-like chemotaxis protein